MSGKRSTRKPLPARRIGAPGVVIGGDAFVGKGGSIGSMPGISPLSAGDGAGLAVVRVGAVAATVAVLPGVAAGGLAESFAVVFVEAVVFGAGVVTAAVLVVGLGVADFAVDLLGGALSVSAVTIVGAGFEVALAAVLVFVLVDLVAVLLDGVSSSSVFLGAGVAAAATALGLGVDFSTGAGVGVGLAATVFFSGAGAVGVNRGADGGSSVVFTTGSGSRSRSGMDRAGARTGAEVMAGL